MPNNKEWNDRWLEGDTPWSYPEADDAFYKDEKKLISLLNTTKELKILFPLSGSTPLIKYFHDKGHSVTAVEFSQAAVKDLKTSLFSNFEFVVSNNIHKTNRLEIHESNFLEFNSANEFDLIYDRAAFVAIEPKDRKKYASILSSTLKTQGLLYITLFEWGTNDQYGPPYTSPLAEVEKLFSNFIKVSSRRITEKEVSEKMKNAGIFEFYYTHTIFRKS